MSSSAAPSTRSRASLAAVGCSLLLGVALLVRSIAPTSFSPEHAGSVALLRAPNFFFDAGRSSAVSGSASSASSASSGWTVFGGGGAARSPPPSPTPLPRGLARGAYATYVMGDRHARMALALMQSLRDARTAVPHLLVLVSHNGRGGAECEAAPPAGGCTRPGAPPEDMLSHAYVRAFARLNVSLRAAPPVPRSRYTDGIAGGAYAFWGSAYNKLNVLRLTEFERVVWMDSDTLALQSLDHLFDEAALPLSRDVFRAAFTINCCVGVRGKLGGSLWLFQPSEALYQAVLATAETPSPWGAGGAWSDGDQQVVAFTVAKPLIDKRFLIEYWPWLEDYRQGLAPGFRMLPQHRDFSRAQVDEELGYTLRNRFPPALYPALNWTYTEGLLPRAMWPDDPPPGTPVWHPLDARYDIMVGNCECQSRHDMAGRVEQDYVGVQMTAHFSCLQPPLRKPGEYETEAAFMADTYSHLSSCQRWYYARWYAAYARATGGLPAPLYDGPPVPGINVSHDEAVVFPKRGRQQRRRAARALRPTGPPAPGEA